MASEYVYDNWSWKLKRLLKANIYSQKKNYYLTSLKGKGFFRRMGKKLKINLNSRELLAVLSEEY